MKYFLISAVIMLLGCSMPGVGELEERVDDLETTAAYDDSDLVEMIDEIGIDVEALDLRVTAIEYGGASDITPITTELRTQPDTPVQEPEIEKVLVISDITGLQDSMDEMRTSLSDSIALRDVSIENLVLSLDSLTMENDSLKVDLADLQDQIESLSNTVENMRYTGTSSTSSSGTSGRGSSTSGGSTGGSTR